MKSNVDDDINISISNWEEFYTTHDYSKLSNLILLIMFGTN